MAETTNTRTEGVATVERALLRQELLGMVTAADPGHLDQIKAACLALEEHRGCSTAEEELILQKSKSPLSLIILPVPQPNPVRANLKQQLTRCLQKQIELSMVQAELSTEALRLVSLLVPEKRGAGSRLEGDNAGI